MASASGPLAIVFPPSIFAIQQVAPREATVMMSEYAWDRNTTSTYWIPAAIARIYFAPPFISSSAGLLPTDLVSFCVLLIMTFLLIYRHCPRLSCSTPIKASQWAASNAGSQTSHSGSF